MIYIFIPISATYVLQINDFFIVFYFSNFEYRSKTKHFQYQNFFTILLKNEARQHKRNNPIERHQLSTPINPQTKVHEKHRAKENLWTPYPEQYGTGFEKTLAGKNLSQWHSLNLQGAHMATTSQKQPWYYIQVLLKFTQESPET
jgi:hypothetical protein